MRETFQELMAQLSILLQQFGGYYCSQCKVQSKRVSNILKKERKKKNFITGIECTFAMHDL
jgi:uncharacterized ferredoxin-like protein